MSTICIIIPIHNRLDITKEGLRCIAAAVEYYRIENQEKEKFNIQVLIVDDGSTDGSAAWIRNNYPLFHIIYGDGNLWWTGAANEGVKYCLNTFNDLEAVIFQNDDIIIDKYWLANLLKVASKNRRSLIGCATTIPEKSDEIQFGGTISHPWFSRTKHKNRGVKLTEFPSGHVEESFYLSGRGLYIPKSVFTEVGLFDHTNFKHRGDVDLPLRAKKAGYRLLVSYDALVFELPQYTYNLDAKKRLSTRELFTAMTDFRSSYSIGYVYYYSRAATRNAFQFSIFFACNLAFHMKALLWKYLF